MTNYRNVRYKKTYFDFYKNVWRHGDLILINNHKGVKIYGRSDATLNPGGVRIGTSEIYQALSDVNFINDSLVVGQKWNNDERSYKIISTLWQLGHTF